MNRQERRQRERIRKAEKRIENKLIKKDEVEVELYFNVIGLALEEIYGFKAERIRKVWQYSDDLVGKIASGEETLESIKNKLNDKAHIICEFH